MIEDKESLPPPIWVDTQTGCRAMLAHLRGERALAVDTESNSLFVYQERVCLIQISVPGADYLVDPLALRDLSGLGPLFSDPAVLKVMHGSEYDLSSLHRDFFFTVANLFDTMWASRILGWPEHGLGALLKEHFGVSLDKKYQRANWGVRPLPPAQLDYARLDTHYLLALHSLQARQLDALRRWPQAEHRFTVLTQTHWETKEFDPDGFWQMTGVRELDDAGRGVLRSLFLLRNQQAQAKDCPPFKIRSNGALLALSEQRPHDLQSLYRVKDLPAWLVRTRGKELLAAIQKGAEHPLTWEDRPRPANGNGGNNGRPTPELQARFEALRSWRNAKAVAWGVEPDIILTNQALWAVVNHNPRSCVELSRDGLLAGWQVDEFGKDVLAVIRNMP